MSKLTVTAAAIAIGDELLSGRTQDKNMGYLAQTLTSIGIDLCEIRIVQDKEHVIIESLNALRGEYDYIFTSGGIGPTHDDITAEAVSRAFSVECIYDDQAMELLSDYYKKRNIQFTEARQRMARMPEGASHIKNIISGAPGFNIDNVYVMAGVPKIFQAMLAHIVPTLKTGQKLISQSIGCPHGEGVIGTQLARIQEKNINVSIGSYPRLQENGNFSTEIIVRGINAIYVDKAVAQIRNMLRSELG